MHVVINLIQITPASWIMIELIAVTSSELLLLLFCILSFITHMHIQVISLITALEEGAAAVIEGYDLVLFCRHTHSLKPLMQYLNNPAAVHICVKTSHNACSPVIHSPAGFLTRYKLHWPFLDCLPTWCVALNWDKFKKAHTACRCYAAIWNLFTFQNIYILKKFYKYQVVCILAR